MRWARDEIARARLTLRNGPAQYEVNGSISLYPHIGRSSFISDLDVSEQQLQALARTLLPVLEGPGDITLAIAPGAPSDARSAHTQQIPTAGLASALGRFRDVCFR